MAETVGREHTDLPFFMEWTCPGEGDDNHPHGDVCFINKLLVKYINTSGSLFGDEKFYVIEELHSSLWYLYGRLAESFITDDETYNMLKAKGEEQKRLMQEIQKMSYEGFSAMQIRLWEKNRDKPEA